MRTLEEQCEGCWCQNCQHRLNEESDRKNKPCVGRYEMKCKRCDRKDKRKIQFCQYFLRR